MSVDTIKRLRRRRSRPVAARIAGAIKQALRAAAAPASNICSPPPRWNPISTRPRALRPRRRAGCFSSSTRPGLAPSRKRARSSATASTPMPSASHPRAATSSSDPAARNDDHELRDDPAAASSMAAVLTQSNSFKLTGKIGRRPTDGELYMAHFMGVGGAAKLISNAEDNPQASGARLFPNAAAANRSIFYERSGRARTRLRSLFSADLALCRRRQFSGYANRDGLGLAIRRTVRRALRQRGRDRQCGLSVEFSECPLGRRRRQWPRQSRRLALRCRRSARCFRPVIEPSRFRPRCVSCGATPRH